MNPGTLPHASATASIGSPSYTWMLSNQTALSGLRAAPQPTNGTVFSIDERSNILWLGFPRPSFGVPSNITRIDLTGNRVIGEVPGTQNASAILFDPTTNRMYVAQNPNATDGRVLVLNATTAQPMTSPIAVGAGPVALVLDPYSQELLVADQLAGNVTFLSTTDFRSTTVALPVASVGGGGGGPMAMAYDPVNGDVYVLCSTSTPEVFVLNGTTGALDAPAIQGAEAGAAWPLGIVYVPSVGRVFSLSFNYSFSSQLVVIDPLIQAAVSTFSFPANTYGRSMILDPVSGLLLFTGARSWESLNEGHILTLNPSNGSFIVTTAYLGPGPTTQVLDRTTHVDFVAHDGQSYISEVYPSNDSTMLPIVQWGGVPSFGAVDPTDGRVYIPEMLWHPDPVDMGSLPNRLLAITPSVVPTSTAIPIGTPGTRVSDFVGGAAPDSVAYDPVSHELFVADYGTPGSTVLGTSGGFPAQPLVLDFGAAFDVVDPANGIVYFAASGVIAGVAAVNHSVVSTYSAPSTFNCGLVHAAQSEQLLAVDPGSGHVFFLPCPRIYGGVVIWNPSNGSSRAVSGPAWRSVAYDPADGDLYLTGSGGNLVDVLNATTGTRLGSIPVGNGPDAIAFDPNGTLVLVANSGSNNITVLDGRSFSAGLGPHGSVPAGIAPMALTVDPALGQVFVSDSVGAIVEIATAPEIASFGATPATTDVGIPAMLSVLAHGGSGALSYSYASLPPGCTGLDASRVACAPTTSGLWTPSVTVSDQVGTTRSAATNLRANPLPSLGVSESPWVVDRNGTVRFGALVSGGTPPFSVSWSFGDGGNASGLGTSHAYASAGTFTVVARLTDAVGGQFSGSVLVRVGGALSLTGTPPSLRAHPADSLTWTGEVRGGVGPYSFNWSFGDGTTLVSGSVATAGANQSVATHAYAIAGSYQVQVLVRDGAGETANLSWTIAIVPSPVSPAAVPWLLVGLGGADLAVGALVSVLWFRRRRRARARSARSEP